MKTSSEFDTEVDRSGVAQDGEFGIVFNAKMAKILSDGLYSDKISSIIRELCCNAIDSHVEAGCGNRPIEVHLPNRLEPWFHVRDFGVGLNNEQINNIYTKYGASTKTTSNDFIGQLGLGSKSPFAYVDAFDVTAVRDGRRGQYSMYRNEKGMPSVALLAESASDEPSGVTVKMPVRAIDMRDFEDKARQVFQWFDVQPHVTGVADFTIKKPRVFWQGATWQLRESENRYASRKSSMAVMGRVAYPINTASLGKVTPAVREFLACNAVLNFAIGDLEVAASREALGYDARTQTAIVRAVEQAIVELAADVAKKLQEQPTLWAAKKTWNLILGQSGMYSSEMREILGGQGVTWRSQVIRNGHVSFNTRDIWPETCDLYRTSPRHARLRHSYHQDCDVACRDNTVIIIDDLERGGLGRANAYSKTASGDIWYFGQRGRSITQEQLLDKLGNPPVLFTSSLPKPDAPPRAKAKMMLLVNGNWQEVEVDENQGGAYVLLDRNRVMRDGEVHEDFTATLHQAIKVGAWDSKTPIYAPRLDWRKKIPQLSQWKDFWQVLASNIVAKCTPVMLQTLADREELQTCQHLMRDRNWWEKDWSKLDQDSPWRQFCQRMKTIKDHVQRHSTVYADINSLARELKIEIPGYKHQDPEGEWRKIMLRYPMLYYVINQGWRTVSQEEYLQTHTYIQLVDQQWEKDHSQDYVWTSLVA